MSTALVDVLRVAPGWELPTVLGAAVSANELRESGHSATVALTRNGGQDTEVLVLGDCTVIAHPDGQRPVVLTDARLDEVACEERALWRRAVHNGETSERVHELRRALVAAERAQRNRPGGYWVAADDPAAAREAYTLTLPAGTPVVLMSDGTADTLTALCPDLLTGVSELSGLDSGALKARLTAMRQQVFEQTGLPVDDMSIVIAGHGR